MSEFQFVCPFCETNIECPEEYNGVEIECPVCKNTIVPTPMQAEEKTQDFSEKDVSQKKQQKKNPKHFAKKLAMLDDNEKSTSKLSFFCTDCVKRIIQYWCLLSRAKKILAISGLSIVIIVISSFLLIKKGCPDDIPVYSDAHADTLAYLVHILESINNKSNIKESIEYANSLFDSWNKIGSSYNNFRNAKKYLECNGECAGHKLKYSVIEDAVLCCSSISLVYLENKKKNIALKGIKAIKANTPFMELALRLELMKAKSDKEIEKVKALIKKHDKEKRDIENDFKKMEIIVKESNENMQKTFEDNRGILKQKLEYAILIMKDFDAYKKLVDKKIITPPSE